MLPPEGLITLIIAILIGLVSGSISTQCKTLFGQLGVYFVGFFLALVLGAAVEAHAAGKHFYYDFGDHLLHHLAVAILAVTFVHLAILGAVYLFRASAGLSTAPTGESPGYLPHALGLLNFFPPFAIVAQLIYWRIKRADQAACNEVKEALQFQVMVLVAITVVDILAKAIGGVIGSIIGLTGLVILIAALIQTIVAITKSKQNGSYIYPFNVRLLPRSRVLTPEA